MSMHFLANSVQPSTWALHSHVVAGHYILQMEQTSNPDASQQLLETQEVSETMLRLGPPLFKLTGLAIGNGLTDPTLQVTSENVLIAK